MFKPFQRNSKLGLLVLLGATTTVTLSVFAVYRAAVGDWTAAAIDFGIVLLILGPVVYAWHTGRTEGPGAFLCVSNSLGCALACYVIGMVSLPWIYLVLMTNFFITGPRLALACNVLLTIAVILMPHMFDASLYGVSVAVTAALVTLFAYLFALQVSSENQVLEELASLDVLTGIPNRRMMEQELTEALEVHRSGQRSYGLVIVDLDNFKQVNDTYGHAVGDAAIADLAAILQFEMRRQDRLYRFGGEEFVALLAVDTAEGLHAAAERLRMAVRDGLRGPGGRITVSIGAAMAGIEERWQEWFSLADEALYRAKNKGRDTSVLAG